jgi:hypothetical protein
MRHLSRRMLLKLGGMSAVGVRATRAAAPISLFDGKTLDGWIQIENSATMLSAGGITDVPAFAAKLANGTDPVSVFLRGHLEDSVDRPGLLFRIQRECQGRCFRASEGSERGHRRALDL